MAGGEEAGMGFEFGGGDEGRQGAGFAGRDPGARGAVGAEGGFDLLGVRGELEGQEGFDLERRWKGGFRTPWEVGFGGPG